MLNTWRRKEEERAGGEGLAALWWRGGLSQCRLLAVVAVHQGRLWLRGVVHHHWLTTTTTTPGGGGGSSRE